MPEPADVPPPTLKDFAPPNQPAIAPPAPATPSPVVAAPGGKELAPLATNLAAADVPIAEKLRELVSGKLDKLIETKKERASVEAFYTARGFAPLWIDSGAPSERSKAVMARLKAADLDGLDPRDYPAPDFAVAADRPDALAQAELKLTGTALTFARHASSGRFNATRITTNVDVPQQPLDPAGVLAKVADSKNIGETLDGFDPPQEGFRLLKAKLAEMHGHGSEDSKHIAEGPALKIGMQDARVPLVRERLGVAGDASNITYDAKLVEAVKAFQQRSEMKANGVLDARTVEALNGPPSHRRVEAIIATMERWRWMPRDLGKAYAMVNLPDYSLKVVRDGKPVFHTRIVVGKPAMPTPIFSDEIENIVMNPTWHVPESIIYKEYLPALEQDPTVLERMGLILRHDRSGRVTIEQPPSERNALGRMKFNFPNRFNVYLHDTPDKSLFALERRAFSHGCMRVQNPTAFGETLLSIALPEGHYTAERLAHMFGSGEEWLKFKTFVPVHITYQTAYVDEAGKLVVRDDIYGLGSRVTAALRNADLRVADSAPAPEVRRERTATKRREARQALPPQDTGFSFFGRLFR